MRWDKFILSVRVEGPRTSEGWQQDKANPVRRKTGEEEAKAASKQASWMRSPRIPRFRLLVLVRERAQAKQKTRARAHRNLARPLLPPEHGRSRRPLPPRSNRKPLAQRPLRRWSRRSCRFCQIKSDEGLRDGRAVRQEVDAEGDIWVRGPLVCVLEWSAELLDGRGESEGDEGSCGKRSTRD